MSPTKHTIGMLSSTALPMPVSAFYRERPIRWIKAARDRFTRELSPGQKVRFLARIGSRAVNTASAND
jgi:hypothetical protein